MLVEVDSCWLKHKYCEAMEVSMVLRAMPSGSEVLLRAELRRKGPPEEMLLLDRKGRIK